MNNLHIINLANPSNPQDAATKAYVDAGGGGGFQKLRADASTWLTDSVTLISGDVPLTQTDDSITFDVDWDTLSVYPDTTVTNDILDSLGAFADTSLIWDTLSAYSDTTIKNDIYDSLGAYADTSTVWDTLSTYADTTVTNDILDSLGAYADTSIVWDTLSAYADTTVTNDILDSLRAYADTSIVWDTLTAYFDTTNHFILNQNASVQSADFWLDATGRVGHLIVDSSAVINESGGDFDFRVEGTTDPNLLVADASTDKIGIGTISPLNKIDIVGGVAIGTNYAGTFAAPTDGMIIEGRTGIANTSPNTYMDINGDLALHMTNYTAMNGDNNDIDVGDYSFIKISGPTNNFNILGITGGVEGRIVILYNFANKSIKLMNEDANSVAINRMHCPEERDATIKKYSSVMLIYDAVQQYWIPILPDQP